MTSLMSAAQVNNIKIGARILYKFYVLVFRTTWPKELINIRSRFIVCKLDQLEHSVGTIQPHNWLKVEQVTSHATV